MGFLTSLFVHDLTAGAARGFFLGLRGYLESGCGVVQTTFLPT